MGIVVTKSYKVGKKELFNLSPDQIFTSSIECVAAWKNFLRNKFPYHQ